MTLDVVLKAAQVRPTAARIWLARLAGINQDHVQAVLSEIPEGVASSTAKEYAAAMLELNKERLLPGGSE